MTYNLKWEVPFWLIPLYQHYHTSLEEYVQSIFSEIFSLLRL
jgi:hypothetical protein